MNFGGGHMFGKTRGKGEQRPVPEITRTYGDWFIDAISLVGLLIMAGCLVYYWPLLPETVPTHFGFSGQADGWGSKTTLLIFPIFGLVLFIIMTIVGFFPHTYNYPWKITEKNAQDQYRLAKALMGWLKAEIIWMFLYLTWMTVSIALGRAEALGALFAPLFLILFFGTMGLYFYLSYRAR